MLLGRALTARRRLLTALVGAALMAPGPLGCARLLYNFGAVEPGALYRSSQPSPLFLRYLVARYEIRSVVNLRGRTPGFESAFAGRRGLRIFSFDLSASRPPSQADVDRFLALVRDPANLPLLVHCRNGVDRTGYMVGLYRVQQAGWSRDRAAREMNRFLQFAPLNPVPQQVVKENLRGP